MAVMELLSTLTRTIPTASCLLRTLTHANNMRNILPVESQEVV